MNDAVLISISESSQAGEARRIALALANSLNFNETQRGKVGIVVSELANNLVQHAGQGVLLLQTIKRNNQSGIEIISLDKGPGIANISECLQDGFSTKNTPGNGLGAIQRLSTLFEIHSLPQQGTAILAQIWANKLLNQENIHLLELGSICLPISSETVSGDNWAIAKSNDYSLILVVDGLGHGPMAAAAAAVAIEIFKQVHESLKAMVEAMHRAMRPTRGAALAVAQIDLKSQTVQYVGVGNISATIHSASGNCRMVSHNGTVGHEVRKIQEFSYPWQREGILIMHSDGLGTHWDLSHYQGLAAKHPSLIAGVLYRDFNRGRDDVTVLVAREDS